MSRSKRQEKHTTEGVAQDTHARKLRKFLYPGKKVSAKNRKVLLDLLKEVDVEHPLSRIIDFPQFEEARKQLARLARKHKHID
ncbi:hypothetical protein JQ594_00715 [Bradyrhizobium manausense]|uniref:hypothetical protein n=1 Tax=Bradyrhizobium manausense TaxID=989370 RepID=UPI001BA4D87A|nr:hypothetical protein [Bradyrhizobium manausense]MBR0684423.1 hypothetical protein [Bradyrhizobium manausense]